MKNTLAWCSGGSPAVGGPNYDGRHFLGQSLLFRGHIGYHGLVPRQWESERAVSTKTEPAPAAPTFDPIEFTVSKPLASPLELAIAFGQLIDSISDLTGITVRRVITPTLSSITVSWRAASLPSQEWRRDVETQLQGFAACNGVHVIFRHH